jgi:malate permease and related proteins
MTALVSVFAILAMIGLGFFLSKRRWFEQGAPALLSRLVVGVALPSYMISNLMTSFDREALVASLGGLPVPFATMVLCYALSLPLGALLRVDKSRRGTFSSMFALSNTIFIGLPVNLMIFGEKSVPYVLLYYIANTSLFWTIGVLGISRDGGGRSKRVLSVDTAKRIFSPPLVAFLAAACLILVGIRLPEAFLDVCRYLGGMTTPLSMIFIGIVIASVDWKKAKPDAGMVAVMIGRFLVSPAIVFALTSWTLAPELMRKVFIIQASMPAMTQTSIIAKAYGADYEYAAVMTAATTIASMATIPAFAALMGT